MSEAKVLWVKQGKGDAARYVCNLLGHKLLIGVARNAGGRPDGYYIEIDGQYRGGARTAAEAKRKGAEALRKLVFPGAEPVTQERRRPTMTKHTPGPWQPRKDDGGWEVRAGARDVDLVADVIETLESPAGQAEANARLVAAAPDMYAILSKLVAECLREAGPLDVTVREAMSVLRKAEGNQNP